MQENNSEKPGHRAGFVNIIGNPNAGKSTLMNALLGEKLSIVTPKAQTTRHRIMGILNGDDFQVVYSDTPGVLDPKYKLHEGMMKAVGTALTDADLILLVVDLMDKNELHAGTLEKIRNTQIPVFVLLNKVDVAGFEKSNEAFVKWQSELPSAKIFPVSALEKIYTKEILEEIRLTLPLSPPYFPKDELSDRTQRFFISEIIREKIFLNYQREIPYSCEVKVEEFTEEPEITRIRAEIITERESQKRILIGHQGSMLKRVGTAARRDIQSFIGKKVFLELFVKVDENWRNDLSRLKSFGYWE
ncbi:MAG: GTPase Era [Flavobacteriales bacterium]|nr:GTPase Era [Flavobacteriales bacterium]